jgi:hypothetical protein
MRTTSENVHRMSHFWCIPSCSSSERTYTFFQQGSATTHITDSSVHSVVSGFCCNMIEIFILLGRYALLNSGWTVQSCIIAQSLFMSQWYPEVKHIASLCRRCSVSCSEIWKTLNKQSQTPYLMILSSEVHVPKTAVKCCITDQKDEDLGSVSRLQITKHWIVTSFTRSKMMWILCTVCMYVRTYVWTVWMYSNNSCTLLKASWMQCFEFHRPNFDILGILCL